VLAKLPGENYLFGVPRALAEGLKWMFGSMEVFNREVTYVTAYKIAEEKLGMKNEEDAARYAESIVSQTQGDYGRMNLPPFARGPVGRVLGRPAYSFRFYQHNLLSLYRALGTQYGRSGKYGLAKGFLAMALIGGLPLGDSIENLWRWLTGESLKHEIQEKLGQWAKYVFYGLPAAVGVDLKGSVGMDVPGSLTELIGVPASYVKSVGNAYQDLKLRDSLRFAEDFPMMPTVAKAPLTAYREASRGFETRSGEPIRDENFNQFFLEGWDIGKKIFGFRPMMESEVARRDQTKYNIKTDWMKSRSDIMSMLEIAYRAGNQPVIDKAEDKIADFNKHKPDHIPPITGKTIRSELRNKPTKYEKIENQEYKVIR
jgi:hypothetical protein